MLTAPQETIKSWTKDAYSSTALPPLGRSDHNPVLLTSKYVPLVQRQPVHIKTVRRWIQKTAETLQDCFQSTDWAVLCEPYSVDTKSRQPEQYSAWITGDLNKILLNKKKRVFRSGDKEKLKEVQHELMGEATGL